MMPVVRPGYSKIVSKVTLASFGGEDREEEAFQIVLASPALRVRVRSVVSSEVAGAKSGLLSLTLSTKGGEGIHLALPFLSAQSV
jgi:hypothetical protein